MKKIKRYVDWICDEIEGAKCYAEHYVDWKAKNDQNWANRFHQMADDELRHAEMIHELAVQEIERINTVFKAPEWMQEEWDKAHVNYVEKAAWVRQMLSM